jgi:hypothetical protein
MVTLTVTAQQSVPNAEGIVDVDVYVYDSRGVPVAWDEREDRDCVVRFQAERTESYTVVVVLDRGESAQCKVDY